jgi:SAM-dependent methyltransferase
MKHIKDIYKEAFEKHGNSPASVLWPKGRQDDRFNALTREINKSKGFSVLDFGCGLAHLKEYFDAKFEVPIKYTGVDLLPEFLQTAIGKFMDANFMSPEELFSSVECYDYVLASGTFNILYEAQKSAHRDIVFQMMESLFNKTNIFLSVNFMTDKVDFEQKGAYHQSVTELYEFVTRSLSNRFIIDKSYMPYEYTITIWKD